MIETHEKFKLPPENRDSEAFFIEVNWEDNPATDKCKVLRITFPDGMTVHLDKKYLIEMLFAIGSEEEQRKMIPQTHVTTREYETVVGVKAKKDIRKGEMINFPLKLRLPDSIKETVGPIKQKNSIIIPK